MTEARPPSPELGGRPGDVPRWEKLLVGLLLVWFAGRLAFLALRLHPTIPPDEVDHFARCLAYSKVLLIPDNNPDTLVHGLINHRPYLYYWLMGKLVHLNVFPGSDLSFLRLLNAAMGLLAVTYAYAWMRLLSHNPLVRVLFVALMTNTLMYTGMFAAVSYDNLANLLAIMAVYYLFVFFDRRSAESLAAFALVVLAGALSKRTLLPLGFILVVVLLVRERRSLPALHRHFSELSTGWEWRLSTLGALIALALLLTLGLYGGNLLRYGKLVPGFDQVVGFGGAMENRIFARDFITREFREGRLSYRDALLMTEEIEHYGDRSDAQLLLKGARLPDSTLIGPVAYIGAWNRRVLHSSVSYWGHHQALKSHGQMLPYFVIFALAGIIFIRKWQPEEAGGQTGWAALIVFGYAMVLMWLVNYPSYLKTHFVETSLQGRYMFPVIAPLYGLLAHYLLAYWPRRIQIVLALVVAGVYIYGDFPFLLSHTDWRWFQ